MTGTPVWPTPQRLDERPDGFTVPHTVGLVRTADTDGPALRTVREALRTAGAADIREPHSTTAPKIGDGVIDTFLDAAKAISDRSPALDGRRLESVDGQPPLGVEERHPVTGDANRTAGVPPARP